MAQEIYLFNPDHDLALAQGGDHYVAPPCVRQLQHDLSSLPASYAPQGASVMELGQPLPQQWRRAVFSPWGWNRVVRKRLIRMGAHPESLPSEAALDRFRRLSHRRTTIDIHRRVSELLGCRFTEFPVETFTVAETVRFAREHPGCYVKLPWSGSGRGVMRVGQGQDNAFFERWVRGGLRRQGSLLCEVGVERVMDCAIELECRGGVLKFVGYSIFESDAHHQYAQSLVDTRQALRARIVALYPGFDQVVEAVMQALGELVCRYLPDTHLGVDMLLYSSGGAIGINPCVEFNLRATMGLVAAALGERGRGPATLRVQRREGRYALVVAPLEPAHFSSL